MDAELLDVGAQAERTVLAWQRTGIGAIAVGALLIRGHVAQHELPAWPGLLITVAAGFAVLVLVPRRYRRVLHMVRAGETPLSRGMVPGAALLLVLVTLGVGFEIGAELLRT